MEQPTTDAIRSTIKKWVDLDDEERTLRERIKQIKTEKTSLSPNILGFMTSNGVDTFALSGNGIGNLSKTTRNIRPALKRQQIRTQLLLHFSDQPERVSTALRAIEGIPDGAEDMSVGGTQKVMLVRRVPKN
jgi:hypothetical protein